MTREQARYEERMENLRKKYEQDNISKDFATFDEYVEWVNDYEGAMETDDCMRRAFERGTI